MLVCFINVYSILFVNLFIYWGFIFNKSTGILDFDWLDYKKQFIDIFI